jgi:peptidyl-prolyl cis-trans isomerase B (cyclophilin B)
VAGSAKRERQLAREHYQRQQQRRAEMAARRRRVQQIAAVVVAVVLVVGGVAVLAATLGGGSNKAATAGATSSATPSASLSPSTSLSPSASSSASATTAASGCTYAKSASAASKNVGLPTYEKSKAATYRQPFGATIKTNLGDVVIALDAAKAPCTANSFKHLAQTKFYDKSDCHRLTTSGIFVLQCGDPTGSGSGGPGYQFGVENAPKDGKYPAGTLAMARTSDPNSNGSQFFIVYKETSLPDPTGYTVFGRVTKGLDIVTQVAAAGANPTGDGKPKKKITIESVTVGKA